MYSWYERQAKPVLLNNRVPLDGIRPEARKISRFMRSAGYFPALTRCSFHTSFPMLFPATIHRALS